MSEKKTGLLPKLEVIIIAVFFLSFLLWAATKCSSTRDRYQEKEARIEELDSLDQAKIIADSLAKLPKEETQEPATASTTTPTTRSSGGETILYVTIDGLKLRKEPNLKSDIVEELPLFASVFFMNEYTDFKEEINLGKEVANEPWVKVRSAKGRTGWVYGAGVHYYKFKHPGTY